MKIVFNSRLPDAACTVFYHDAFSRLCNIQFYDYENWQDYDIALFMTYRIDLEDLKKVKTENPDLKTAIIDPRGSWVNNYLKYANFLIVDSLEMRDYWSGCSLPIFEYAEYPDLKKIRNNHLLEKDKIVIGYHGNVVHLESMGDTLVPAIERLGERYDIELWAMYNPAAHGEWKSNLPDVKVKHIQWSMENYYEYLAKVDIGIVPCFLPEQKMSTWRNLSFLNKFNQLNKSSDDYLLRFKMPTNPGRIIVWGLLNIPVVSDFFPSAMQCIEDGKSGLLAFSEGGWYRALEKFIQNPPMRQVCADNLTEVVCNRYSFLEQNRKFENFLELHYGSVCRI